MSRNHVLYTLFAIIVVHNVTFDFMDQYNLSALYTYPSKATPPLVQIFPFSRSQLDSLLQRQISRRSSNEYRHFATHYPILARSIPRAQIASQQLRTKCLALARLNAQSIESSQNLRWLTISKRNVQLHRFIAQYLAGVGNCRRDVI